MITSFKIERFKSLRHLELACRRVNLFIGEPNTGKSNILEALGMLSWGGSSRGLLSSFVRFRHLQNLFYDDLTDEPIEIHCEGKLAGTLQVRFQKDSFSFVFDNRQFRSVNYDGQADVGNVVSGLSQIRKYRFRSLDQYDSAEPGALIPPDGPNLFSVLYSSKALREWAAELFRPYGLSFVLKPHERAMELQKSQDGLVIGYPLSLCSETLQRILFYYVAMESNKDAVLVFEEPEAHAFPYYTKYLGERIAADTSNQYFIATHNPYLLVAVLEKANQEEVAVFATQYQDYETKVRALTPEQISRLLDADPFLGLEGVLEAE